MAHRLHMRYLRVCGLAVQMEADRENNQVAVGTELVQVGA